MLLAGDHTGWDAAAEPLLHVTGTDLFHISYRLPVDARLDYKLIVDDAWILDPLNPHTCPSGFGDNSELRMPEWPYPTVIDFDASIAHGAVNGQTVNEDDTYEAATLPSAVLGNEREVFVYTPPAYDPSVAYPLLVVNDGGEYVRIAHMPHVLDNLIAAGALRPIVVAFVSPVDRTAEYVGSDAPRYVELIETELLPFIEARAHITDDRRERAVMGTSYGGAISLRLTHDLPHVFGMFASQSGILLFDGGTTLEDLRPDNVERVWVDTGLIGDATEDSVAARDHCAAHAIPHEYLEVNEGHSWGSWRARLDEILLFLFPS